MDSSAEFWREPNSNATVSGSSSIQVLKDSINNNDKNGSGRRSSDGGPPPFNRTRSFKSKQLVRSQAIRESQSPPRVPSPKPPGYVDPKENKLTAAKIKSVSVDLDDRLSHENNQTTKNATKERDISNDAVSLTTHTSDSFKHINLNTKNILVSTSGDKNFLGANVVNSCNSMSECKINNNDMTNQTAANSQTEKTDRNDVTSEKCRQTQISDKEDVILKSDVNASSSIDIDHNKVLGYSDNNNDNKCLSLDVRPSSDVLNDDDDDDTATRIINNIDAPSPNSQISNSGRDASTERHDEFQSSAESDQRPKSTDTIGRKQKVSLKNLKNSNFIKNNDYSQIIIQDMTNFKNREKCFHTRNVVAPKVEFHQVEIQVTSGDNYQNEKANLMKHCDCGIGPSLDEDEIEPEYSPDSSNHENEGRRAICPSKQDSGVCCWDSCCGDVSPEIITSDNEEDSGKTKKQSYFTEHNSSHCNINEMCRCSEKSEKTVNRRNGSMLTVQRASSGGNPRLLRKQSSGGSVDSGQHSITSPFLSRDNSTETFSLNPCDVGDLSKFIKDTLNKSQKDRINLLKIEHDLITLVRDPMRREQKFPATSSYGRLLVHRCADLFGLRHGVDPATRHIVTVAKLPQAGITYRIPQICPFQQWCTMKFPASPTGFCETISQAKSILKRDTQSLDEEAVIPTPAPPKLLQTPRSKSFEQREEEYVKARRRIFSSPGQEDMEMPWDWEENKENDEENEMCTPRILVPDSNKSARLLKVQSLEHESRPTSIRGVVSKAHSFGGYGGRQGVQRGDSITSTSSAPPHRILSRQGELASTCWRLSPSSSGYKTFSGRSDSVTPSPTSTPNTATVDTTTGNRNTELKLPNNEPSNVVGGVLWAITDMSTVPPGAVIIHPQTGQALTNSDGSLYHYDPDKPPHSALLPHSQVSAENVRVLSNPERRRCRLEKQRATLSPGRESVPNSGLLEPVCYSINTNESNSNSNSSSSPHHVYVESENHNLEIPNVNECNNAKDEHHYVDSNVEDNKSLMTTSEGPRSPVQQQQCDSTSMPNVVRNSNEHVASNSFACKTSPSSSHSVPYVSNKNSLDFNDNNEFHTSKNDAQHENNEPVLNNASMQEIINNVTNMHLKNHNHQKVAEKSYRNHVTSPPQQMEHFEHVEDISNKINCTEFDPNIEERHHDNFIQAYPEVQDPHYYGTVIPANQQQYYAPGHIYDGNAQEQLYSAPAQNLNYNIRTNEGSLSGAVPQHQLSHPHLIFAPQTDQMGFPPNGEMCYSAPPTQVLLPPPPPYRIHEQESQPPQYHMISAGDQHHQPLMVTLSNKLPEHEINPQSLAGFPIGYHSQVERAPVITAPPIVGVTTPHPTLGYQIQTPSNWGWPQLALYASHPPQPSADDAIHKFQQHTGAFIPPESPLNAPSIPAIPQAFYSHPNFVQTQPNQYFQTYPHHPPLVPHPFPVYQSYNPGRNSVLSQEGCSTPGFQTYDPHVNAFTFPKPSDNVYQDNFNKGRSNVKSPKLPNSRAASNSGSSRTTPLNSNLPMQNVNICDVNFANMDQTINQNGVHIIHPGVNYLPLAYPYPNPTEFTQTNCDAQQAIINQNRSAAIDNQNIIKYNKQMVRETEKCAQPKVLPKQNTYQNVEVIYAHDKVEKPQQRQHGIVHQQDKPIDNTQGKINVNIATNNMPYDMKNLNRNKDRRKTFKPSNSMNAAVDMESNYEQVKSPVKERPALLQNYHIQHTNLVKHNYSNEKHIINSHRNNSHDSAKKNQFIDVVHKQLMVASNLSNDAKTFIPKNQTNSANAGSAPWNVKENQNDNYEDNNYQPKHMNSHMTLNDGKPSWRKNQNFVQKDYHNFPKNFNRQLQRNPAPNNQSDKFVSRNQTKDKLPMQININQRIKPQMSFESIQSPVQVTPTMLNAPPTPWNPHVQPMHQKSSAESPSQAFTLPNLSQPPPVQLMSRRLSQSNDSPSPSTPNTPSAIPKVNATKIHAGTSEICVQQRFIDANIIGLPLAQSATFYQRTQTLQNLAAGGLGLIQTPPLQGHSAYLLRQVPSSWFRRPAAPALFGPAPPITGQIRTRPPRPHQTHPRHFYH